MSLTARIESIEKRLGADNEGIDFSRLTFADFVRFQAGKNHEGLTKELKKGKSVSQVFGEWLTYWKAIK